MRKSLLLPVQSHKYGQGKLNPCFKDSVTFIKWLSTVNSGVSSYERVHVKDVGLLITSNIIRSDTISQVKCIQ